MENNIYNNTPMPSLKNEQNIDIKNLLIKLLKKWYWFALAVLVAGIFAIFYIKTTPPKYSTQSTIMIRDDNSSGLFSQLSLIEGLGSLGGMTGGTTRKIEDEIQVMKSITLLSQIINTLDIQTEYYEKKGIKNYNEVFEKNSLKLIVPDTYNDTTRKTITLTVEKKKKGYEVVYEERKIKKKYLLNDLSTPIQTPAGEMSFAELSPLEKGVKYRAKHYPLQVLAEKYIKAISINPVNKKTSALNISTTSTNRLKAQTIINKLIELYSLEVLADKNVLATHTAQYINQQIELTKQELAFLEKEVEEYKKANNITDIQAEATVALQSGSEYEKKFIEIETQISIITFIEELIKNESNQYLMIPASLGGIQEQSLLLLINTYNEQLLERSKLLRSTNAKNPVVAQLEDELNSLRNNIISSIDNIKESLNLSKITLLQKENQLTSRKQEVPRIERQFIEIKRMQEVKQTMYLFLLQKQYENELSMEATEPPVRVLDPAYSSFSSVAPKKLIVLAVSILLSIIIPFIVIILIDFLKNKISSENELSSLRGLHYLGKIYLARNAEDKNKNINKFNLLRTDLEFITSTNKAPVILVTSSISGEGKSYVATHLASSFTSLNKKVVLLDLNLHSHYPINDYLNIREDKDGVCSFITSPNTQLDKIITTVPDNQYLSVIQAGISNVNSTNLLHSNRLDDLIMELKQSYDYIIIDSAPIDNLPDTYLLNRFIDYTIYVTREDYTSKDYISLINNVRESGKLKNISVILNGAK